MAYHESRSKGLTFREIEKSNELKFLTGFHRFATGRKVDLIVKTPSSRAKMIYETAKREGILLC